jgi:ArsR family transcriptional regulator, repressor of sdpIR and other operons
MNNISLELNSLKHGLAKTCYRFFSTLANPTRLAILEILNEGPKSVGDIASKLKEEQSMISHNLKALERCGFIFKKREKKQQIYSLNAETMKPLFKLFIHHSEKYCPTGGKCLGERSLKSQRKKEASVELHVTH